MLWKNLGSDVPDELEGGPGAQNCQSRNQHAQDLEAKDGACALHIQLRLIADPIQREKADAQANGLADPAGEIEGAVDGAFGALAGDVFIIVDGFAHQTPLHLDGNHGKAGANTKDHAVEQGTQFCLLVLLLFRVFLVSPVFLR